MNAIIWAFHIAVLIYALPLLRDWWHGAVVLDRRIERKRWLVVLGALTPPITTAWLLPMAIAHNADLRRQERRRAKVEALKAGIRQRAADVVFWREQVAQGDVASAAVGVELLSMWGVPVVESVARPATGDLQALPGSHEYSHGCDCRNCVRARAADPRWRGSGPLIPSGHLRCRCGAVSNAEMCTVRSPLCGRL